MSDQNIGPFYLKTTETFVRFYVLLSQFLDRCQDESTKKSLPEQDFQKHLADTRAEVLTLLSTNRVVKEKVEQESERILSLGTAFTEGRTDEATKTLLGKERETLRIKMLALSDLLAVFRSG